MAEVESALADRVLPRRAAAKRSSKLSAEQLESSSSDAEEEDHAIKKPLPLEEPPSSRGTVKYTYSSRRKSRPSPTKTPKATGGSPPPSPRSPARKPPVVVRPSPRGRDYQGNDKRSSRSTLSSSKTFDGSLTPLSDDDPEVIEVTDIDIRQRTPSPIIVQGGTGASPAETSPERRNFRSSKENLNKKSLKRRHSHVSLTPSLDSLTPSDSPPVAESSSPSKKTSNFSPKKQDTLVSDVRNSDYILKVGNASVVRVTPPPSSASTHIPIEDSHARFETVDAEEWSSEGLGVLVWVKLNEFGQVVQQQQTDSQDDITAMWWPAKVVHGNVTLSVSLFGHSPGLSALSDTRETSIAEPSRFNVLSMMYKGRIRFHEDNYRIVPFAGDAPRSPRKKQKTDLDARWKAARDIMLQADEDDNDGLPSVVSSWIPSSTHELSHKARQAKEALSDHEESELEEEWEPPKANMMYELPGELVLAREKRSSKDHWPAKLLEYIPPPGRQRKPKYKVYFYDGAVKNIEVDMFFTTVDEGFKTCILGQDGYNYGLDEEADTDTLDSIDFESDHDDEDSGRASPPPPTIPAPPAVEFAYELSIDQQFQYVKPVLEATLQGSYGPSQERHISFMRGAKHRQQVCNTAGVKGDLRNLELEELYSLIWRWVRRKEKRGEMTGTTIDDPVSENLSKPSKPPETSEEIWMPPSSSVSESAADIRPPSSISSLSDTEVDSSDVAMPPSSSIIAESEVDPEVDESLPDLGSELASLQAEGGREELPIEHREPHVTDASDHPSELSPDEDVDLDHLHSTVTDGEIDISDATSRTCFENLSKFDKHTYCMVVLLREAVLQLLLWRSGTRRSYDLLSADEELGLHDIAEAKSKETYWVHDIINMKRAVEGKMLSTHRPTEHMGPNVRLTAKSFGGTRSRPRKAT